MPQPMRNTLLSVRARLVSVGSLLALAVPVQDPLAGVSLVGQLREIEARAHLSTEPLASLMGELVLLESRVGKITGPLAYADELYALRNHIDVVRQKITQA